MPRTNNDRDGFWQESSLRQALDGVVTILTQSRHITRQRLARLANVYSSTVTNVINGRKGTGGNRIFRAPTPSNLDALIRATLHLHELVKQVARRDDPALTGMTDEYDRQILHLASFVGRCISSQGHTSLVEGVVLPYELIPPDSRQYCRRSIDDIADVQLHHLFRTPGITLVIGLPKSGKSCLALRMAAASLRAGVKTSYRWLTNGKLTHVLEGDPVDVDTEEYEVPTELTIWAQATGFSHLLTESSDAAEIIFVDNVADGRLTKCVVDEIRQLRRNQKLGVVRSSYVFVFQNSYLRELKNFDAIHQRSGLIFSISTGIRLLEVRHFGSDEVRAFGATSALKEPTAEEMERISRETGGNPSLVREILTNMDAGMDIEAAVTNAERLAGLFIGGSLDRILKTPFFQQKARENPGFGVKEFRFWVDFFPFELSVDPPRMGTRFDGHIFQRVIQKRLERWKKAHEDH